VTPACASRWPGPAPIEGRLKAGGGLSQTDLEKASRVMVDVSQTGRIQRRAGCGSAGRPLDPLHPCWAPDAAMKPLDASRWPGAAWS